MQSKLNEGRGPALYLTPNKFLAAQTCQQATEFGISYVTMDNTLPTAFVEGKSILVTHVQKLFNGKSKFGIGPASEAVASLVVDDSHACIDAVRDAYVISLTHQHKAYDRLVDLFATELEKQGVGTFSDIRNRAYGVLLPVPYWDWHDKVSDVAAVLSEYAGTDEITFAWPLLRDILPHCQCIVSGQGLEIAPHVAPIERFGSFAKASHRVFMSATVADDSFFVKGLGLDAATITNPLMYANEKWSGEKMILIPSLIDESLTREKLVQALAPPLDARTYGVVALVPSKARSKDWKAYGAVVATRDDIDTAVSALKAGKYANALVIVNRYDGIDLPDSACRILVMDSRPRPESLLDTYTEACRPGSEAVAVRITRAIEQGLGRSVRGEKDYCAMILIGPELIKHVRLQGTGRHFSAQTRTQIQIGHNIAEFAKEDIADGKAPLAAFVSLMAQSIRRDEGWKSYYVQQMDAMAPQDVPHAMLDVFAAELKAERAAMRNAYEEAASVIQGVADRFTKDGNPSEQGWYVQEKARYTYPISATQSNTIQIAAHKLNTLLLKPKTGMVVSRITIISHKRVDNVKAWVTQHADYTEMIVAVDEMLSQLVFGVRADRFEQALHELGHALGFVCQRPDKEWKEGPDNLWAVGDGEYMLFECKNEVQTTRAEINKAEAAQMNTSLAWFKTEYPDATCHPTMIIPTAKLGHAANLSETIGVMRVQELAKLVARARAFFVEFKTADFKSLSDAIIQQWLNHHELTAQDLASKYVRKIKDS